MTGPNTLDICEPFSSKITLVRGKTGYTYWNVESEKGRRFWQGYQMSFFYENLSPTREMASLHRDVQTTFAFTSDAIPKKLTFTKSACSKGSLAINIFTPTPEDEVSVVLADICPKPFEILHPVSTFSLTSFLLADPELLSEYPQKGHVT